MRISDWSSDVCSSDLSDEDQKRLRVLEEEIKRLKNSEPMCVIQPQGELWAFSVECFPSLTEEEIQSLMAMVKEKCQPAIDFGPQEETERHLAGIGGIYALYGRDRKGTRLKSSH